MSNHIGLYYPFLEFRDDTWVKFAALYWDKIGRIVPPKYRCNDSEIVKQLTEELGFVINFQPSDEDLIAVAELFRQVLVIHGEELVKQYGIASIKEVVILDHPVPTPLKWRRNRYGLDQPQFVDIIAHGKIPRDFKLQLIYEGLALPLQAKNLNKGLEGAILMHSKLAYIYIEVLAERMASVRLLHPLADNLFDHLAINGYTLDRLIQVLLEPDAPKLRSLKGTPRRWNEIEILMATVALRSVLPQNLANVSVKKIIKLRNQHSNEMAMFQNYIHEFVAGLEGLQDVDDPTALKAHLEAEYEKVLKPQLENLKENLRSLGIDTVEGVMNIRVGLPPLLATAGAYFAQAHAVPFINPIVAGTGAIAYSVFPVIRSKHRVVKQVVLSTPAAYLLYTQEGLTPLSAVSQITHRARRLIYGV